MTLNILCGIWKSSAELDLTYRNRYLFQARFTRTMAWRITASFSV